MARTKAVVRYSAVLDDSLPPVAKAVALWMCVMDVSRTKQVSGIDTVPETLVLTDEQLALLTDFEYLCRFIDRRSPPVSVFVCPECERWHVATSGGSGPCKLTFGCHGKPKRVPAASRVEIAPPADNIDSADATGDSDSAAA